MSVPAGQMGQDPKQKQAEGDSHKPSTSGIQSVAGAAAKMGSAKPSRTPS
jgi:hypothetical protein